jgi:hypothetical protein
MQYALVNGVRSQAQKGLEGVCELCNSKVISKCGSINAHHWSHYNRKECDKWWEAETIWHRDWKDRFPEKYREVIFKNDSTKEIHRADIYTSTGLTLEFQHSLISNDERISRESFYNNLIWVVDGSRRTNDYKRFQKKSHYLTSYYKERKDIFQVSNIEDLFPSYWTDCSVPVIFDFSKDFLYCLFPKRVGRDAIVAKISPKSFIKSILDGEWEVSCSKFLNELKKDNLELKNKEHTYRSKLNETKALGIPNKRHWRL